MRGRRPQPTSLRLLKGNPGKRPLPRNEPAPAPLSLIPPDWLSEEAKAEWARVAPMLDRIGVLSEADASALAGYCECWARWRKAEESVAKTGLLVRTPSGFPVMNPLVGAANKALGQMRAFLVEFGMTPSARTRVQAKASEQEGAFQTFLAGKARHNGQ